MSISFRRVQILSIGRDGLTRCFMAKDINTGEVYTIYNCHRTESLFWRNHNMQCYVGSVDIDSDIVMIKKAYLRIDCRSKKGTLIL